MTPRRIRSGLLAVGLALLCLAGQVAAAASAPSDATPFGKAKPGGFGKVAPANGAMGQSASPTLSWGAAAGATGYFYCLDTTNDNACAGNWISVGNVLSAQVLYPLNPNTTYYWQVEAGNYDGYTGADGGAWWSFTTAAFQKESPTNGATGVSLTPVLSWHQVAGAGSYSWCVDTNNDSACNGNWISAGTNTSVGLSQRNPNTAYYWQVRVHFSGGGTTEFDGGTWWSFTTAGASGGKIAPANGSTGQPLDVTLSWALFSGAGARYARCFDTTNNDTCDGSWLAVGSTGSNSITGLTPNTTYYWQVRSDPWDGLNYTYADGGAWWSFTAAPFNKESPGNGAAGVPLNPTLSWHPVAGADAYWYCVDTTDDGLCQPGWQHMGMSTSANPAGLSPNTTYYWQAEVRNAGWDFPADGGTWWSFTTAGADNDDFDNANVIGGLPYTNTQPVGAATTAIDDPYSTCSAGRYKTVWYRYTAPTTAPLIVDTFDSSYDTVLAVWKGTRGNLTSITCNDDAGSGIQSKVTFVPTAGTTYYIEVSSFGSDPTAPLLTLNVAEAQLHKTTFRSQGTYDGWILESAESTDMGGSLDATATTARVGDSTLDRQYRSILSFNTASLPENAIIVGVSLRIQEEAVYGTNPFTTHGNLIVDIKKGPFYLSYSLEAADFASAADRSNVGKFNATPASGWFRSTLKTTAYPLIDPTAVTQLRLRFVTDDNDDGGADYLSFYTGNAPTADRPRLIVTYYLP